MSAKKIKSIGIALFSLMVLDLDSAHAAGKGFVCSADCLKLDESAGSLVLVRSGILASGSTRIRAFQMLKLACGQAVSRSGGPGKAVLASAYGAAGSHESSSDTTEQEFEESASSSSLTAGRRRNWFRSFRFARLERQRSSLRFHSSSSFESEASAYSLEVQTASPGDGRTCAHADENVEALYLGDEDVMP